MCTGLELLAAAGTGLSIAGNFAAARGARADALLEAELAKFNAEIGRKSAEVETVLAELPMYEARIEEVRLRDEVDRVVGEQTAGFAAANLDPSHGSPLLLAGMTVAQAETDIALIRAEGGLGRAAGLARAASAEAGATTSEYQAAGATSRASQVMTAAWFGAGTAFLNFAGKVSWPGLSGGAAGGSFATRAIAAPMRVAPTAPAAASYGGYIPGGMGIQRRYNFGG